MSKKELKVAIVGNLPTAVKIVQNSYENVLIKEYERGTDLPMKREFYDLILVNSYAGEGIGLMGLTCNYKVDGEMVTVPVRLLNEPPCYAAQAELSTLIKSDISLKLNNE